jgi:hypothetical protein
MEFLASLILSFLLLYFLLSFRRICWLNASLVPQSIRDILEQVVFGFGKFPDSRRYIGNRLRETAAAALDANKLAVGIQIHVASDAPGTVYPGAAFSKMTGACLRRCFNCSVTHSLF